MANRHAARVESERAAGKAPWQHNSLYLMVQNTYQNLKSFCYCTNSLANCRFSSLQFFLDLDVTQVKGPPQGEGCRPIAPFTEAFLSLMLASQPLTFHYFANLSSVIALQGLPILAYSTFYPTLPSERAGNHGSEQGKPSALFIYFHNYFKHVERALKPKF